jgi:multidrug resistance efflux pump
VKTHRVFSLADCVELARIVPQKPPIAVVGTVIALVALVAGGVAWAAIVDADVVVRAPARVRAKSAPRLSFTASSGEQVFAASSGRVANVLVAEGATVRKGDALAVLDTTQLENDRARLAAAVVTARDARDASVRMMKLAEDQFDAAQAERAAELAHESREASRSWRRTSADVEVAVTTLEAARREASRLTALLGDGAASQTQVDQATAKVREAQARLGAARAGGASDRAEVLRKQIALAERDYAVRREELAQHASAQTADLAAAEKRLANVEVEIDHATLRADIAGVVGSVGVSPGDIVQPTQGAFTITPSDGLRVDAAVAASDVALLRVGMRVRVRVDAFDWQRYGTVAGTIAQLGTDAESIAIAPGRQAQVYIARIDLDDETIGRDDARGRLKLGMTGTVEIVVDRDRLLPLLLGRLRQGLSLQ